MARSFNGNLTHHLRYGGAVVSAYPFTMACWANPDTITANYTLMWTGVSSSNNQYCELSMRGGDVGDPVAAVARNTTYNDATTSSGFSASTWNHCAGVWSSSTSRAAYLNGGSKGTDTASVTFPTVDRTTVGKQDRSTAAEAMVGLIAFPCIWNVALSDAEVAALGKGIHPLCIRPEAIVAYWPLWGHGSPEPDEFGGFNLTVSGTSQSRNNPRIIYSQRNRLIYIPAAGGGGTSVPVFVHHYRMQGAA